MTIIKSNPQEHSTPSACIIHDSDNGLIKIGRVVESVYQIKGTIDQSMRIVGMAIKLGLISRPDACELCGASEVIHTHQRWDTRFERSNIVAHHWNGYSNPLDIWFICRSCNRALAGEYFHSGQVTREQAIEIIKSKSFKK